MASGPECSPHGVWSCLLSTSSLTTLTRLAVTLFCRVFLLASRILPRFSFRKPFSWPGQLLLWVTVQLLPPTKAIHSSEVGALPCAPPAPAPSLTVITSHTQHMNRWFFGSLARITPARQRGMWALPTNTNQARISHKVSPQEGPLTAVDVGLSYKAQGSIATLRFQESEWTGCGGKFLFTVEI